ncbi:MAG: Arm DNA-binding domain-containing protein, partial [Acidimicrobiales bacterium]
MSKRAAVAGPKRAKDGTWWFVVDLGPGPGRGGEWKERRQAYRRGFATKAAAQEALDELRVSSRQGTYVAPARQTMKAFLELEWLPAVRRRLAESTYESY